VFGEARLATFKRQGRLRQHELLHASHQKDIDCVKPNRVVAGTELIIWFDHDEVLLFISFAAGCSFLIVSGKALSYTNTNSSADGYGNLELNTWKPKRDVCLANAPAVVAEQQHPGAF
jgi:hypothetical protein